MPKKQKKPTGEEARKIIFTYMKAQNRPFNAQMLFLNLHKAVGKAELVRQLEAMTKEGKVEKKTFGRQAMFWASQENLKVASLEELGELDEQLKQLRVKAKELKHANAALENTNKQLSMQPTDTDAKAEIESLKEECAQMDAKLKELRSGDDQVSEADRLKLEKLYESMRTQWRKRRKIANDVLAQLSEGSGKKISFFKDTIGLETDSDVEVDYNIDKVASKRKRVQEMSDGAASSSTTTTTTFTKKKQKR